MGHWDFSDGPFCEDFDDAKDPNDIPSSLRLWCERAAQKDAEADVGKQNMRPGPSCF
jgi:hypothetical protein